MTLDAVQGERSGAAGPPGEALPPARLRPKVHSLAIELTAFCNQKCGYCYNDWRGDPARVPSLEGGELRSLVERAITDLELDHVTLTGGEPFARADIFELLELLERHGLRAIIISNGGLVTPALAARLARYRPLFVQVTLNGPDAGLHEEHVGKGHFEPTVAGIRALRGAGVSVTGCIVVTRKNAHRVGETIELFASLGVVDVALSRYSPAGYAAEQVAELLPSRSELLAALRQAEPFGARGEARLQVTMPVPPCVVDTVDFPSIVFSSCPIGTEMQELALGPRGELRNCTLHTEVLGDLRQVSAAALVSVPGRTAYRDTTPAFCAPCPMRSRCIGGCGAAAYAVTGDARGLDPFVGQHVDEGLAARLGAARAGGAKLVPLARLSRGVDGGAEA